MGHYVDPVVLEGKNKDYVSLGQVEETGLEMVMKLKTRSRVWKYIAKWHSSLLITMYLLETKVRCTNVTGYQETDILLTTEFYVSGEINNHVACQNLTISHIRVNRNTGKWKNNNKMKQTNGKSSPFFSISLLINMLSICFKKSPSSYFNLSPSSQIPN